MLAKIFLVVFLTTSVMSLAKDDHENDIINTILGSGTVLMREASKYMTEDQDKLSVDLKALYKKYEIAEKADQAKNFFHGQLKRGFESTNEYVKKLNIEGEDQLKKSIDIIKKEDSVLAEKLTKFYDKSCDLDRLSEDIIKYVLDVEKVNGGVEKIKKAIHPLEIKLVGLVKKLETIILEHVPKKGKK